MTPDDEKLMTLARGARGRVGAQAGAAVRDDTGRTYAGADVVLPSLRLSAVQLAVAQAVAAGARSLEAAALVAVAPHLDRHDRSALHEAGGVGIPVFLVASGGDVAEVTA